MDNFENRFRYHLIQGLQIERALDIGAYRGDFTRLVRKLWPAATVWQFEADERQKVHNPDAIYALLGNRERECDFYTVLDDTRVSSTGSSIYREVSEHYRDPTVLKKQMTTIDSLMDQIDFSGDWKAHGIVKLDTQGSELDILAGAAGFLERFTPRLVLLEASVIEYNQGGPLVTDVLNFMKAIRYQLIDMFDVHYAADDRLIQIDLLFEAAGVAPVPS
jgi:FkbM family methyltransferase